MAISILLIHLTALGRPLFGPSDLQQIQYLKSPAFLIDRQKEISSEGVQARMNYMAKIKAKQYYSSPEQAQDYLDFQLEVFIQNRLFKRFISPGEEL